MTASRIFEEVYQRGGELSVVGDRLRYRIPKTTWSPDLISDLKAHKSELIRLVLQQTHKPYIDKHGDLIIPFGCLSQFRWWDDRVEDRMKISEIWAEIERHRVN